MKSSNKRKSGLLVLCASLLAVVLVVSTTGCQKLRARDQLNQGVRAYEAGDYETAIEHFKRAIELDPQLLSARLYLATAYMTQYIPGAESPENLQMAQAALQHFQEVLDRDPNNEIAIASIASIYFNMKNFDEAVKWYNRLIEVNPQNKTAYYTLGVIAWTKAFKDRMEARAKLGMKPEDPGPLRDRKVREELRQKNLQMIEEGIEYIKKALEIDPEYDDAMAYYNLLLREKADLMDSKEEYDKLVAEADQWVQKALQIKKIKAERAAREAGGLVTAEE